MHRLLLTTFLAVALLCLAGCEPKTPPPTSQSAVEQHFESNSSVDNWFVVNEDSASQARLLKSPADDRDYRYLRLANGLQVVLISDSEADKAAASLSIDIGSFENPPERDGLAHFLEHMLFLGTDKFPEPGEYQAFLSEHGGTFNAYTSLEETNYFFDVDAEHLMPTLDRFSRFFVAPLFNSEYVDRERHAVDSEYQLKIKDDSRRSWDVLRELANPQHPFSGFSVGNLDTLANPDDNPVRDDLLAFYDRYYSANRMTLVVLGKESLDQLQQDITARFDQVPAKVVDTPHSQTPLFRDGLPIKIKIKPEKEARSISFNFPLPSVESYWQKKPLEYLGYMLGHEGEGSLIQSLKDRGLAEALSAGLVYDSRHGALFSVDIRLTANGLSQQDQVVGDFFRWLELITRDGIEEWRYHEIARLSEQSFRFAEKTPPMDYVRMLSTQLHQVSPELLLMAGNLYEDYDEPLISRFAALLSPDNVAIVVTAPEMETDTKTRLYDAPYGVEPLSPETLLARAEADLFLPRPNPYITEDLALTSDGSKDQLQPVEIGKNRWFYPDQQFASPKGYFEARIAMEELPGLTESANLDLALALINDSLAAQRYPAMLAGLHYSVSDWDNGYIINLSGYNDKQGQLLAEILGEFTSGHWREDQFSRVRDSLVRSLRNQAKEWPLKQLFTRLGPLVRETWLPSQKAEIIENLTLDQINVFRQQLLVASSIRFYAGGNFSRIQAEDLFNQVSQAIENRNEPVTLTVENFRSVAPLPEVSYFVDHDDAAAILYLQGQEDTLVERATFTLLNKILSAPFYSTLRTEKQLGYAVGSSISHLDRVPGIIFYVQSPKMDAAGLRLEINQFLDAFEKQISELDKTALARFQAAVLASIEEKPRSINELAGRHLESLDLGYQQFDFRPELVQAVKSLTVDAVASAYSRAVLGERAGLWILTSNDQNVGVGQSVPRSYLEKPFRLTLQGQ